MDTRSVLRNRKKSKELARKNEVEKTIDYRITRTEAARKQGINE